MQTAHFRPLNVESIKRKHKNIQLGAVHMRWADSAGWTVSPKWDDFYPTFIQNLLPYFNQKVCYVAGKDCCDYAVFKRF